METMSTIIKKDVELKKSLFRNFLLSRNPSEKFVKTYFVYLNSSVVTSECLNVANTKDIFNIDDRTKLETIYSNVKKYDRNIANHNVYSGAISAFLKFLDGRTLRPMRNTSVDSTK